MKQFTEEKKAVHALVPEREIKRMNKAQKATPIKNKSEFLRLLIDEALSARGF